MFGLFKRGADQQCVDAAAFALNLKLDRAIERFCQSREIPVSRIDDAITRLVEAQMFVVSLATSLANYLLIDAYYDAGKVDPIKGPPPLKLDHDQARRMLRDGWMFFSPLTRMNLDMRYRYILVAQLMSPEEEALWVRMERWSEKAAEDHIVGRGDLRSGWLSFIEAAADQDIERVNALLDDPYSG